MKKRLTLLILLFLATPMPVFASGLYLGGQLGFSYAKGDILTSSHR